MKRLALLVASALLATTLALIPYVAAWYETPVRSGSYSDGAGPAFNFGGSTKYGYNGPATDTHPQFYAGAETHTVCDASRCHVYDPASIKITVTGVDPNGVTLAGNRFPPLSALHSPSGGTYEEVMNFVYQSLVNLVPYGIGSDIAYLADSQPTQAEATSAWGQWTEGIVKVVDSGLEFGFQIQVDPTLSGSYRIHVVYHFVTHWRNGGDAFFFNDLSDDLIYCYNYCSYNIAPIHVRQGGYPVSGAELWIYDSGGYSRYHDWTDANGNAPGKWGLPGGTYTVKAQECESVYRPEPPGYDYFYFKGQTTVTIGPNTSPTVSVSNSGVRC